MQLFPVQKWNASNQQGGNKSSSVTTTHKNKTLHCNIGHFFSLQVIKHCSDISSKIKAFNHCFITSYEAQRIQGCSDIKHPKSSLQFYTVVHYYDDNPIQNPSLWLRKKIKTAQTQEQRAAWNYY